MSGSESSVAWTDRTSAAIADLPPTTLVLPVGATEQHGPHLPTGVDATLAAYVATAAAERASTPERPVLVAPVLSYGSSHHHLPLAGTLSLSSSTMRAVLYDLLTSVARTGIASLVLLNGHGGNDDLVRQAARDAALEFDVVVAGGSYWTIAGERLERLAAERGIAIVPGHAGAFETSLMLGLGLIDGVPAGLGPPAGRRVAAAGPRGVAVERHDWVSEMGTYSDDPTGGSAADGRAFFEVIVDACATFIRGLAGASSGGEGCTT